MFVSKNKPKHLTQLQALVAGSNLVFGIENMLTMSNMNFFSPAEKCYSFDERANGYSRGEGFGVILVKLLSEAIRDGDTIRAVIRSTGSNQDGRTPGITQPSSEAQAALIRQTYGKAGLDMKATRFFEAHGEAGNGNCLIYVMLTIYPQGPVLQSVTQPRRMP